MHTDLLFVFDCRYDRESMMNQMAGGGMGEDGEDMDDYGGECSKKISVLKTSAKKAFFSTCLHTPCHDEHTSLNIHTHAGGGMEDYGGMGGEEGEL